MTQRPQPILQPPGAGVPLPERLILRFFLGPFVAKRSNWEQNWQKFDSLNQKIFRLLDGLTTHQLQQKILVPPQRGLEDSSRDWSAAMVLEHLIIVGSVQKTAIIALSRGVVPDQKASTAAVKPKGGVDGLQQLEAYKAFLADVRASVDMVREAALKTNLAYAHPWFGPCNPLQWQWLYAAHTAIHYQQLKEIVKILKA